MGCRLWLCAVQEELGGGSGSDGSPTQPNLPLEVGVDFSGRGTGFLARGLGAANPLVGSVQLAVAEVPVGALIQLQASCYWGIGAATGWVDERRSQIEQEARLFVVDELCGCRAARQQCNLWHTTPAQLLDTRWGVGQFKRHLGRLLAPPTKAIGPGGILDRPAAGAGGGAASSVLLDFACTTVANDEPWVLAGMQQQAQAQGAGSAAAGGLALQGGKFQGELAPGPDGGAPVLYSFTSTMGWLQGL